MDDNKNCTICNIKLDIVNYLKHRTVCKTCYNKNRQNKYNKQNFHADVKKVFESVNKDITDSSKEINFILESLNNKIDDVLDLLEVIKSRIPRSTRS